MLDSDVKYNPSAEIPGLMLPRSVGSPSTDAVVKGMQVPMLIENWSLLFITIFCASTLGAIKKKARQIKLQHLIRNTLVVGVKFIKI
jgi:hypothetical protein